MRINNVEYPNVSIRVIESKRVVGLTGPKSIHLYEANIKKGAVIYNIAPFFCFVQNLFHATEMYVKSV